MMTDTNKDGAVTASLFNDIENILYDCIFSSQGEACGLEEAYDKITTRIKEVRNEALEEAASAVKGLRYIEKDHWSSEYRQGGQAMNIGSCEVIQALKSTGTEGEG